MKPKLLVMVGLLALPMTTMAKSFYCPQNHGYISQGMTEAQVIASCGQPMTKQIRNTPVRQKVPVKQLIYTALNTGSVYPTLNPIYDQWSIPSGSTGVSLEVDVINNKVSAVRINGSSTNAMSICGGVHVEVGDHENQVYTACGNPDMVNNSFILQPVPSNQKPEVWIYQIDPYQPPLSLTFVNGKLQSLD